MLLGLTLRLRAVGRMPGVMPTGATGRAGGRLPGGVPRRGGRPRVVRAARATLTPGRPLGRRPPVAVRTDTAVDRVTAGRTGSAPDRTAIKRTGPVPDRTSPERRCARRRPRAAEHISRPTRAGAVRTDTTLGPATTERADTPLGRVTAGRTGSAPDRTAIERTRSVPDRTSPERRCARRPRAAEHISRPTRAGAAARSIRRRPAAGHRRGSP
ncbi:hypothetical protein [Streptomyces purpurascens]